MNKPTIDINNKEDINRLKVLAYELRLLVAKMEDYHLLGEVGALYEEKTPEEFRLRILDALTLTNDALECLGMPEIEITFKTE